MTRDHELPAELAQLPKAEFAFPGPLRDRLVAAVLDGSKTASTGLVAQHMRLGERLPRAGDRAVVLDSAERPAGIIETTDVRVVALGDVDLGHVVDEGEGYGTVAAWRRGHEEFWLGAQMRASMDDPRFTVDDATPVVLERFRLVTDLRPGAAGPAGRLVTVPQRLADCHASFFGAAGRGWIARLPRLAEERMTAWQLRPDGPPAHGMVALVLPVLRADGTPAALKLQPVDDETGGEPAALRAWRGRGAVRLLEHDPGSGAMLLERLDPGRSLAAVEDPLAALRTLSELLARLTAVAAPEGMRRLADLAPAMLDRLPAASARLADPAQRRLLDTCAGAVRELLGEPGDRLLHWDLHYENVLAGHPPAAREPWVAIDPKPLAGDPGFDLLPALANRWAEVAATGHVPRAVRRRFDLMTDVVALDRDRAAGWTLGRVLQNALWDTESGATALDEAHVAVAHAVLGRWS